MLGSTNKVCWLEIEVIIHEQLSLLESLSKHIYVNEILRRFEQKQWIL